MRGGNELKICLRVDLEGKITDEFNRIKEDRGITINSELVRLLIKEAAKKLDGK